MVGYPPDGLAAVYEEHPVAVDVAFAENRSEVLGAPDPLTAAQQVHWSIDSAFIDYQTAAEERRQLAADIGETIRQFLDALVAAGWTEEQARNANVHQLVGLGICIQESSSRSSVSTEHDPRRSETRRIAVRARWRVSCNPSLQAQLRKTSAPSLRSVAPD